MIKGGHGGSSEETASHPFLKRYAAATVAVANTTAATTSTSRSTTNQEGEAVKVARPTAHLPSPRNPPYSPFADVPVGTTPENPGSRFLSRAPSPATLGGSAGGNLAGTPRRTMTEEELEVRRELAAIFNLEQAPCPSPLPDQEYGEQCMGKKGAGSCPTGYANPFPQYVKEGKYGENPPMVYPAPQHLPLGKDEAEEGDAMQHLLHALAEEAVATHAAEYPVSPHSFRTRMDAPAKILRDSLDNARARSCHVVSPLGTHPPEMDPAVGYLVEAVSQRLSQPFDYRLKAKETPSGQAYVIQNGSWGVWQRVHEYFYPSQVALFKPLAQERGNAVNPQGRKNLYGGGDGHCVFPSGEFYLRDAVAYALDQHSAGVFHIPVTTVSHMEGLGEGVLSEYITPANSDATPHLGLERTRARQFRLLFDLFFMNGDARREPMFGKNLWATRHSPGERPEPDGVEEEGSMTGGSGTRGGRTPLPQGRTGHYYLHNSYILPETFPRYDELIASFRNAYGCGRTPGKGTPGSQDGRGSVPNVSAGSEDSDAYELESWHPDVLRFLNSIEDPWYKYYSVLRRFGFSSQTISRVALSVYTVQRCAASGLTPDEIVHFAYTSAHPFMPFVFRLLSGLEKGVGTREQVLRAPQVIHRVLEGSLQAFKRETASNSHEQGSARSKSYFSLFSREKVPESHGSYYDLQRKADGWW